MNCKNCIHYEVCESFATDYEFRDMMRTECKGKHWCVFFRKTDEPDGITNYEKIKSLSVEEMEDFITDATNGYEYGCAYCANFVNGECSGNGDFHEYVNGCIEWLNSKYKKNKMICL